MKIQRTLLASAILTTLSGMSHAQTADALIARVIVTASPFGNDENKQILTPAKVLAGAELRDKIGSSLGDTLSQELGVSASAFGAGASRPIIRGLEGARVKMLENGMTVSDVSGLSNDHAVSAEGAVARQIEILRGPAALLYGSGAIGGLVNVVNARIPTALEPKVTGQIEARASTVDNGRNVSGTVDGASGHFAWHLDGNLRNADDYKIPGHRTLNDPDSASGRLPHSDTRERNGALGGAFIDDWGYVGASVSRLSNVYGIPSDEGSKIDQKQTRYDLDSLVKAPFSGFENFKFKAGYTDYQHAELDENNAPVVIFKNRSLETRTELSHKPIYGWRGTFGVQTENTNFSALSPQGNPDTVPVTHSTSTAAFLVEEGDIGVVKLSAGGRLERVKREPVTGAKRSFDLHSASVGGLWPFIPGYGVGATVSYAQRAPAAEELYSGGPHDATVTFDIGNPDFKRETSRNVELTLQKTAGMLRWKTNVYQNKVSDFIYGRIDGTLVDEAGNPGSGFRQRVFQQADATLHGAEAELEYKPYGPGWSGRVFGDTSRGKLDGNGKLPLQPASRVGISTAYQEGPWRAGVSLLHAMSQDRLAAFENNPTSSYNQVNANLSYTQNVNGMALTYFLLAKNLTNDEIRLSTSVLKDISPLPGRNIVFGVRTKF